MDCKINLNQIILWGQQESKLFDKFREFGAIPKKLKSNVKDVKIQSIYSFYKIGMNGFGVAIECSGYHTKRKLNAIIWSCWRKCPYSKAHIFLSSNHIFRKYEKFLWKLMLVHPNQLRYEISFAQNLWSIHASTIQNYHRKVCLQLKSGCASPLCI